MEYKGGSLLSNEKEKGSEGNNRLAEDAWSEEQDGESDRLLTQENIFVNLKVIAKIRPQNKITILNGRMNIDSRYLASFCRWWSQDDRGSTLDFIEHLLRAVFEMNECILDMKRRNQQHGSTAAGPPRKTLYFKNADAFLEPPDDGLVLRLTTELDRCVEGLQNLKQSYANDCLIESRIDFLVDEIKIFVNRNSKLLEMRLT